MGGENFVRDYIEFYFDGPVLRALSAPILRRGSVETRFPQPGSRDALCDLIGQTAIRLEVRGDQAILITFGDGAEIIIPLEGSPLAEPGLVEFAHFVPGRNQPMQVW